MGQETEIRQLQQDKGHIVTEMRRLIDGAKDEDLSPYEEEKYQRMEADLEAIEDRLKSMQNRHSEGRDALGASFNAEHEEREVLAKVPAGKEVRVYAPGQRAKELDTKVRSWHRTDVQDYNDLLRKSAFGLTGPQRTRFEMRAVQMDADVKGGYLTAPEIMENRLIQALDNLVFVRRHCTIIALKGAASVTAPVLDADLESADWTAELATGSESTAGPTFEKRALTPNPLAKRLKVSNTLLFHNPMVNSYVNQRFAYQFAIAEENCFLNGTGANQPLGIFVASDSGVTTTQDVSTGNTTTSIKADGLIHCLYDMPAQYRLRARWLFSRQALSQIRRLKSGTGDYLWQPGLAGNRPDTILSVPYDESEYAPSTFTTGLYVGALCNWEHYWIVESRPFQVAVLRELYAEENCTGYIGRREVDGSPVLAQAFRRVTLA